MESEYLNTQEGVTSQPVWVAKAIYHQLDDEERETWPQTEEICLAKAGLVCQVSTFMPILVAAIFCHPEHEYGLGSGSYLFDYCASPRELK